MNLQAENFEVGNRQERGSGESKVWFVFDTLESRWGIALAIELPRQMT
jgi:hypothetical protein